MWAASYMSPPTLSQNSVPKPPLAVVSAKSQPQQDQDLGRVILPVPKQQKQKEQQSNSPQLSGSEVLFAMQKAATKKRKEMNKKKMDKGQGPEGPSSAGNHREEKDVMDYTNVRPLCVKSDWGPRLDELEMRLQELSDIV